jgi:HEAT repeat protein
MIGSNHRRLLALALCLLGLGFPGCKGNPVKEGGLFAKTYDTVPGIMPPAERIAAIRKMSQEAVRAGVDAQEQLAVKFAGLYPQETDPLIRVELVRASAALRCPPAVLLVRQATKDSDADVRIAACKALPKQQGAEAAEVLAGVLGSDTDLDVRLAAARALGELRNPAAVPPLATALEESDPAMQHRAVSSLRAAAPEDVGSDATRWREYVKGEPLSPPKTVPLAERIRGLFY